MKKYPGKVNLLVDGVSDTYEVQLRLNFCVRSGTICTIQLLP